MSGNTPNYNCNAVHVYLTTNYLLTSLYVPGAGPLSLVIPPWVGKMSIGNGLATAGTKQ